MLVCAVRLSHAATHDSARCNSQLNEWRLLSVRGFGGTLVEELGYDPSAAQDDGGVTQDAEMQNVTWGRESSTQRL